MTSAWNPRLILNVCPDSGSFTCVGTTLQNARCRNGMISGSLLREAAEILDTLPHPSQFRQDQPQILSTLKRLAYCTLCPRWHRDNKTRAGSQIDPVAQRWRTILLRFANDVVPQSRSGSSRSRQLTLPSQLSILPRISEVTSTHTTTPSTYRRPLREAYPSPPPSRSTTPSNQLARSANHSSVGTSHEYSRNIPSSRASTSSTSSNHRSASSRTLSHEGINVQVNVSIDLDTIRRRRIAALDTPPVSSAPQSPPSSSPTPRRSSISLSQYEAEAEVMRERVAMLEAQLAELSNRSSRTSSRSSSGAVEHGDHFQRSRAPTPSTVSNFSVPPPAVQNLLTSDFRTALQRGYGSSLSISTDAASTSRRQVRTPDSSGASTPAISLVEEDTTMVPFQARLAGALTSPRAAQALTIYTPPSPYSSGTSTPILVSAPTSPVLAVSEVRSATTGRPRRRPIADEPCYVCYESIERPEDAVWCRSGCGQNICLECFENWTGYLLGEGRLLTCGFCRASWTN